MSTDCKPILGTQDNEYLRGDLIRDFGYFGLSVSAFEVNESAWKSVEDGIEYNAAVVYYKDLKLIKEIIVISEKGWGKDTRQFCPAAVSNKENNPCVYSLKKYTGLR